MFIEKAEKYKDIHHQHDVWHGGKNIAKKINAVSIFNYCVTISDPCDSAYFKVFL
jgi:hypothetical protein